MFIKTLDNLMLKKNINKNILAKESGIPYTTIDGFYKKGCENIKLSTLQKLCSYFNVTLDYLVKGDETTLTEHEKRLVSAYRNKPDMQNAVDRLLGIDEADTEQLHHLKIAARNGEFKEITVTDSELEKIQQQIDALEDAKDL